MKNMFGKLLKDQKGQVLPLVLCLLAVGSLTIAASLNYSSLTMKGGRIVKQNIDGIYAAGAGVEHTIWSINNGVTPLSQLPEQINGMAVNMDSISRGTFTLVFGEMFLPLGHTTFLTVNSSITWNETAGMYKYTITVTSNHSSAIHFSEIGARLPPGYVYDDGSAALFPDNFSTAQPATSESNGAMFVRWQFGNPSPQIASGETKTQSFYLTGSGNLRGNYSWVIANREDIGAVGDLSGSLYTITSTAKRVTDNRTLTTIISDVLIQSDQEVFIASWRINE